MYVVGLDGEIDGDGMGDHHIFVKSSGGTHGAIVLVAEHERFADEGGVHRVIVVVTQGCRQRIDDQWLGVASRHPAGAGFLSAIGFQSILMMVEFGIVQVFELQEAGMAVIVALDGQQGESIAFAKLIEFVGEDVRRPSASERCNLLARRGVDQRCRVKVAIG